MHAIIARLVDDGELLEVHAGWARNIIVGFARIQGIVVGLVANQLHGEWPARWTSTPPTRARASSASATPSTSRSSRWSTCPASCPASSRSAAASSATAPRCCSPTPPAPTPKITLDPAQGLRRLVPGDVQPGDGRRHGLRLADRRDRGDGRGGRGQHALPQGAAEAADRKARARRTGGRVPRRVRLALPVGSRGYITDVIEPAETRSMLALSLRKTLAQARAAPGEEARQRADVSGQP